MIQMFSVFFFLFSFVQKPKKGVTFLQENGLIGPSAAEVAEFFHDEARIDPVRDEDESEHSGVV